MSAIYEIFGSDAHSMTLSLMEAARVSELIPEGASVALEPNLVVAGSPENGATTHAGVLSGCIEYLQAHKIANLSVIESSWVGDNTDRAMKACGYDKVCSRYGVPFYPAPSDTVKNLTRQVRKNSACSACYAALVRGLYIAKKEGISVDRDIAIGQGWRGKGLDCLGAGNCCAGAKDHAAGCPPTAAEVLALLRRN